MKDIYSNLNTFRNQAENESYEAWLDDYLIHQMGEQDEL
jgi:hypothetical protein